MLGYLANTLVFFLSGLIGIGNALHGLNSKSTGGKYGGSHYFGVKLFILYIAIHVIRAVMLFILWPIIAHFGCK